MKIYNLSKIDNEIAFPIFFLSVSWLYEGEQKYKDKYPQWYEGLSDGICRNSTGYDFMPKNPITLEQVQKNHQEWWDKYKKKGQNPYDIKFDVKFIRNEVWKCDWFCHMTWDFGQSNEQILTSFQNFIYRMKDLNQNESYYENGIKHEAYCLMGAEDIWRWHGEKEGSNPPCRCEGCKKWGVVRINH